MDKRAERRGKSGIWAAIGAAAGLGNALRFPSLCHKYGDAFFVAYAVCVAAVCFPLLCAELELGKNHSFNSAFLKPLALCAAVNSAVIALYYVTITAQICSAFASFAPAGGAAATNSGASVYLCGGLAALAIFFCARSPSVMERTGRISVVISLALACILALACLTSGGTATRLVQVNLRALSGGGLWADALGQSLLALSLAGGVMPALAGAFPGGVSTRRAAALIICANLAGCVLYSVCALSFALPVEEEGGITLAVNLYPRIIYCAFGGGAGIFGTLFFLSLTLTAVQSACSLFAPALSRGRRTLRAACLSALAFALMPLFLSDGGEVLAAVDRMACSVNAVLLAFFESLALALPPARIKGHRFALLWAAALFRALCLGAFALFSLCGARFASFTAAARLSAYLSFAAVISPLLFSAARLLPRLWGKAAQPRDISNSHKNL